MESYVSKVLSTRSRYSAKIRLKAFSNVYSYSDYVQDWRKPSPQRAPNFELVHAFSVTLGLPAEAMLKQAQFQVAREAVLTSKAYFHNTSSGDQPALQMLDPRIQRMFQECVELAGNGISVHVHWPSDGQAVDITLKYNPTVAADESQWPRIYRVHWHPADMAACLLSSGPMPSTVEPALMQLGFAYNFHCEARLPVAVAEVAVVTDRGIFQVPLSSDAPMASSDMGAKVKALQGEVHSFKANTTAQLAELAKFATSMRRFKDVASANITAEIARLRGAVREQHRFEKHVRAAFNRGVCNSCYTCGGRWPYSIVYHEFDDFEFPAHGEGDRECGDNNESVTRQNWSICCMEAGMLG